MLPDSAFLNGGSSQGRIQIYTKTSKAATGARL